MEKNIENTISLFDKLSMKYYGYLYTASIAKEAVSSGDGNSGGVLIIGMIIVIVGLVGFMFTKNRN